MVAGGTPLGEHAQLGLASTCTIGGRLGLLLVEAKAHQQELHAAMAGKYKGLKTNERNHEQIGAAIAQANDGLNRIMQGWNLSRDAHYQVANRIAWGWKVALFGVPVIVVYLGFVHADEWGILLSVRQRGNTRFGSIPAASCRTRRGKRRSR